MPFRHVVMFKWAEDVEPDHPARVREGLDELRREISEVRAYVHGADVGISSGNYDYAVVADFDDANDFLAYRNHPKHLVFIEEHITGKVAQRAAVQYEV